MNVCIDHWFTASPRTRPGLPCTNAVSPRPPAPAAANGSAAGFSGLSSPSPSTSISYHRCAGENSPTYVRARAVPSPSIPTTATLFRITSVPRIAYPSPNAPPANSAVIAGIVTHAHCSFLRHRSTR